MLTLPAFILTEHIEYLFVTEGDHGQMSKHKENTRNCTRTIEGVEEEKGEGVEEEKGENGVPTKWSQIIAHRCHGLVLASHHHHRRVFDNHSCAFSCTKKRKKLDQHADKH